MTLRPRPYRKDYEITDAMFGAFRSPGGAALFWKLTAILSVLYTAVYLLVGIPMVQAYANMIMSAANEDVGEILSGFGMLMGLALLMFVLMLGGNAVVRASFYRSYFFGSPETGFPLRFGAEEGRQFFAILGFWGLYLVITIGLSFVLGLIIGFSTVLLGDGGQGIAVLMMVLLYIGIFAMLIWFLPTFAPAGPLTALRGRVHVLAARHVAKNRFWALFGSALVAGLIGYVVYYVTFGIGAMVGLSGFLNADMMGALVSEDFDSMERLAREALASPGFKVGIVIAVILSGIGTAFYQMILAGPPAFFTRQWAEMGEDARGPEV